MLRRPDASARRQHLWERAEWVRKRIEQRSGKSDDSSRNGADQRLSPSQHLEIVHRRALEPYRSRPYPGNLTLFRAAEHPASVQSDAAMDWRRLAGAGVEICAEPGDHLRMIDEPHCRVLAERLSAALHEAGVKSRAEGWAIRYTCPWWMKPIG